MSYKKYASGKQHSCKQVDVSSSKNLALYSYVCIVNLLLLLRIYDVLRRSCEQSPIIKEHMAMHKHLNFMFLYSSAFLNVLERF